MKKYMSAVLICGLTACATPPQEISAASVSHLTYSDYSCRQIGAELDRVSRKANTLFHSLDKKASDDSAQMAVGMVLFWPALFFLEGGDGPEAAEYARLKGELDALETVAVRKECGIEFPKPPVSKTQEPSKNKNTFQQ